MKRPEFPKPRLIREDFLPEKDSMDEYRIKKITTGDGTVWYYPQKKVLWFWWNIGVGYGGYGCYEWANGRIIEDYQGRQKDKVEYLEPDYSKTYSSERPLKFKKTLKK